ncbi:MAG: galactokinase [Bryobacterales bacterium]|nr:galactokinase [Bryobacteraceae bacterium]MDW8130334.1 galactokinase [Bryobacterales bacterium]
MVGAAALLSEAFLRVFGPASNLRIWRAPGRVNLIGEHTDYNLGFVLPMALELACYAATAPRSDDRLRVFSENYGEAREWPVGRLAAARPAGHWSDYLLGVARELVRAGYEVRPANLLVWSTVPPGSGLSSSAALEVSVALALLDGRPIAPLELVQLCRRAENDFVGAPCGIMDQYVAVFGQKGAAIRIDCRSLEHQPIELPAGIAVLAVNTMVKHELGHSSYPERVAQCRQAAARLGVESLRDVTLEMLEKARAELPDVVYRRARHVVTENLRVEQFMKACAEGDLATMGRLLVASHKSLRDDYEVSCDELDFLVETALGIEGVLGGRMTGGGFGGCTVNLLEAGAEDCFHREISEAYRRRFGRDCQIYPCVPAAGAGQL